MLGAMALAMSDPNPSLGCKSPPLRTKDEDEAIQRKYRRNVLNKRGVNEYKIDGYTVYARDYKNACRKVENLKKAKLEVTQ